MSQRIKLPKLTEKGLLTPDNCIVAMIDWSMPNPQAIGALSMEFSRVRAGHSEEVST